MTTDPFTKAARAEAKRVWRSDDALGDDSGPVMDFGQHMAEWARTHLAAQEPSDAECLAVLNVAMVPLGEPPKRNGLADWNPAAVERVRAALFAARTARRDEEHEHEWRWKQNTTSRGLPMPPIEVCRCGAARDPRRDEGKR